MSYRKNLVKKDVLWEGYTFNLRELMSYLLPVYGEE